MFLNNLSNTEFINLFGLHPNELIYDIIISPIITKKFIPNDIIIQSNTKNLFKSYTIKINNKIYLLFKTLPYYGYNIDLINFLYPYIKNKNIFFFGAAGILDDSLKLNQLLQVNTLSYVDMNNNIKDKIQINTEHEAISLLSLPFISLETKQNLSFYLQKGFQSIDLEAGFVADILYKYNIVNNFKVFIFGSDYPFEQEILTLNTNNFNSLTQTNFLKFLDYL